MFVLEINIYYHFFPKLIRRTKLGCCHRHHQLDAALGFGAITHYLFTIIKLLSVASSTEMPNTVLSV